jgi:IS605 OrfB family transposase
LQCQHQYIANSRKDFLNKLAHSLIRRHDSIALKDLQIKGLVRNHHLSKSILDAGWGYVKQRLADKAVEAGRQIVLVNPAYTSKTCSSCGELFPDLSLADRWIECACGLSMDRDVNAAINVLRVGHAHSDESTDNGRGLSQEAPSLERQGSVTPMLLADGKLALVASVIDDAVWNDSNDGSDGLELHLGSSEYESLVSRFLVPSKDDSTSELHVYEDTLIDSIDPKDEFPL